MSTFPFVMKRGCLVFYVQLCPVKTTIAIHCAVLVTLTYFTFHACSAVFTVKKNCVTN